MGWTCGWYQKTWQRLIDRHDMLRAIVRSDGRQQILATYSAIQDHSEDVSEMSPESIREVMAAMRREMSHQVLPSDTWPLFEIRALKLSDTTLPAVFQFRHAHLRCMEFPGSGARIHSLYSAP